MRTQSAKSKGRELQKHVAKQIRDVFELHEDDVVSRPLGSGGEDIMMSHSARSVLPMSIECKNTKSFPSLEALRQSESNSREYTPVACWKPPRKSYDDTIIYMKLSDFLDLWKEK
ncbi:MAG: hypothetical protein SVK08_00960 [Halobacteriota archaeon]|nr:hypothetical protein [Halobacteriota archaeon]